MDRLTFPPFAYFLLTENAPPWYHTLLKVARKDLGIDMRETYANTRPGSDSLVVVPPDIPDSGLLPAGSQQEQLIRDAVAARRILPFANRFLYYSFSKGEGSEITELLGMTIVRNLRSMIFVCSEIPSRLEEHEIERISEYGVAFGLASDARFLLHELSKLEREGKSITPLMPGIIDCLTKAESAGLLKKDKASRNRKGEIAVADLRTALLAIERKNIDAKAFNRSSGR